MSIFNEMSHCEGSRKYFRIPKVIFKSSSEFNFSMQGDKGQITPTWVSLASKTVNPFFPLDNELLIVIRY